MGIRVTITCLRGDAFGVTFLKEVTFSSALSDCLLEGLHKTYWTDFHRIRWKGGTWATEESNRVYW